MFLCHVKQYIGRYNEFRMQRLQRKMVDDGEVDTGH